MSLQMGGFATRTHTRRNLTGVVHTRNSQKKKSLARVFNRTSQGKRKFEIFQNMISTLLQKKVKVLVTKRSSFSNYYVNRLMRDLSQDYATEI